MRCLSSMSFALAALALVGLQASENPSRLLRFPDIHKDFVIFVHGGDIWRASVKGGPARQITSHPGQELTPKISPDGKWIAYSAEYTGTRQIYLMPSDGGEPKQLTYYNDVGPMSPRAGFDYWILGWTPDGKVLSRMNRVPFDDQLGNYYTIDPQGGLEKPLEMLHGGTASFHPGGKKIAYCPITREFRTWKRSMGGRAQDVWIYDLEKHQSEKVTDWRGTDNFPMWAGDTLYFTSDREKTLNIFAYDSALKTTQKVTDFNDFDVLWPSLGPDAIVFTAGGELHRMDLASRKVEKIPIEINAERPLMVPHFKDLKDQVSGATVNAKGSAVLLEARGDLFALGVTEKGVYTRNLTQTQGVRERDASFSPDGAWVAYLSDQSGEYELYLKSLKNEKEVRQITKNGEIWRFAPVWSPDGKSLVFSDRNRRLFSVDVASGKMQELDRGTHGDILDYRYSPDGQFLAYTRNRSNGFQTLCVYSFAQKKAFFLGDGLTQDSNPVWSRCGSYIFFLSDRDFNLSFSSFEMDFVHNKATRVYGAALHDGVPRLFPLQGSESLVMAAEEKEAKTESKKDSKPESKPDTSVRVEAEGFVQRTFTLPGLPSGNYQGLQAGDGALYYLRGEDGMALYRFDLKKQKEEKLADGVQAFEVSGDGQKLLYQMGGSWHVGSATALNSGSDKLNLAGLTFKLDPRAEFRQIYHEAWRIFRDWFYDAEMHGVDWKQLKDRYAKLLPSISHRAELNWLLGELIGELEAGHTYAAGGDEAQVKRVEGGMLGCEFEVGEKDRYRISRIFSGENWDEKFRSPLTEVGVNAKVGEYLLAIDGVELTGKDNPYRLLEGKAGQVVSLTFNTKPTMEGARTVQIKTIRSEVDLRYIDWVKSRMERVEKLSKGRIGYLHLPNTAVEGNLMLQKLFYAQVQKEALIIDDRYNGGGFIPTRLLDYLKRTTQARWAKRDVEIMRSPDYAHNGPKAMLINGYSSSGGDCLPYFFRKNGLGKLIGTRTWGGLIGLSGSPALVDGGSVMPPTFRIFDEKGKWIIENEGVSPDVEVQDLPEALRLGQDPSVDKAVELLLEELAQNPVKEPSIPKAPQASKR